MAIPRRLVNERPGTFFVTTKTLEGRYLLQSDRMASLCVEVLVEYRNQHRFSLHEYTIMRNHIHVLLTPNGAIVSEAMQLIKGRISYEAGKRFGLIGTLWQRGFTEHCIRDEADYFAHRNYIWQNAVKKGLTQVAEAYPYCSANRAIALDPWPVSTAAKAAGV
jgi:putative transposase